MFGNILEKLCWYFRIGWSQYLLHIGSDYRTTTEYWLNRKTKEKRKVIRSPMGVKVLPHDFYD